MTPEQDYVRRATRGLRGQARQATQAELLDHLTARACQLVLGGLSHEQARAQAMQELGAPATVARSLRREQGFTTAGQLTLGTLIGLTLLISLTARLYAQGNEFVSTTINRVLFTEGSGWVDPCLNRANCISLYTDAPLTLEDARQANLIRLNDANRYLEGSGIQVRGLLRKSLTLKGYASQPIHPVEVGRNGHPGTQKGYLNLPSALNSAAQQGWPVQLSGDGLNMTVNVAGQPLRLTDQLGMHVIETYLQQFLDEHLKTGVVGTVPVRPSTFVQVNGWAFPFSRAPKSTLVLSLKVPDPQGLYAVVSFVPEHSNQQWTSLPALRALHVPVEADHLNVPMFDLRDAPPALNLVNSREHFLTQVRAGHATAMLIEVPRDLHAAADMGIVKELERTLILKTGTSPAAP